MPNKGAAAGLAGLGVLFVWSGLRGASVTGSLKDLLSGKQPKSGTAPISNLIAGGGAPLGETAGSGALGIMLSYVGIAPYKWGGATPQGWDCSGAMNWCRRQAGMSIPGSPSGQFSGHGPVALQYFMANAPVIPEQQAQPGDVIAWLSHVGMVTAYGKMVSALDPKEGTTIGSWSDGPFGEPMVIKRF